jgi:hypothetical protein
VAAPSTPNVPDFFIVGQPKCGTTAMYEMLTRHPQVFMPEVKEPHFFVADASYRNAPVSLEDYLGLFDGARPDQRVGEASASYLWSHVAAQGIARVRPDASIIAILREPSNLLRSLHLQMLESRVESEKDLRRALDLESDRREGRSIPRSATDQPQLLYYSGHVRYVDQLKRYQKVFPEDQILILIYDDFSSDNEGTIRRVLRFLELDEKFEFAEHRANPTVQVRSPRAHQFLHSLSVGSGATTRILKRGVKAVTPQPLRQRALHAAQNRLALGAPQPADAEVMDSLRRQYKPEVEALSTHLGRDLVAEWGYSDIA